MDAGLPASVRKALPGVLPVILPFAAIVLARLFTFTGWAAAHPHRAAALYAWIVFDSLLLALLARAPGHRPAGFDTMAAVALASAIVLAGAAPPVRAV